MSTVAEDVKRSVGNSHNIYKLVIKTDMSKRTRVYNIVVPKPFL